MPFELLVALRYLREGRMQSLLILAGVTGGVAVMIFLTQLINQLQVTIIDRSMGSQAHVVIRPLRFWPSTVAYIAALILHRFKVLGLLDDQGHVIGGAGALALPGAKAAAMSTAAPLIAGQACPACGVRAYIKRDGCMFCTACGHQGECG